MAGPDISCPYKSVRQPPRWRRYASCCGLGGAHERFDHGTENNQAIGRAESGFHRALGMRHQSSDVALVVADSSDIVQGTVGIACRVVCSVRRGVAENDLMIFLDLGERSFVAGVVAIVVRDGNF